MDANIAIQAGLYLLALLALANRRAYSSHR